MGESFFGHPRSETRVNPLACMVVCLAHQKLSSAKFISDCTGARWVQRGAASAALPLRVLWHSFPPLSPAFAPISGDDLAISAVRNAVMCDFAAFPAATPSSTRRRASALNSPLSFDKRTSRAFAKWRTLPYSSQCFAAERLSLQGDLRPQNSQILSLHRGG